MHGSGGEDTCVSGLGYLRGKLAVVELQACRSAAHRWRADMHLEPPEWESAVVARWMPVAVKDQWAGAVAQGWARKSVKACPSSPLALKVPAGHGGEGG